MGHSIIKLPKPIYIAGASTVVGHEEFEGPLGEYFDFHDPKDDTFGMNTWEKAESEMQRMAVCGSAADPGTTGLCCGTGNSPGSDHCHYDGKRTGKTGGRLPPGQLQ